MKLLKKLLPLCLLVMMMPMNILANDQDKIITTVIINDVKLPTFQGVPSTDVTLPSDANYHIASAEEVLHSTRYENYPYEYEDYDIKEGIWWYEEGVIMEEGQTFQYSNVPYYLQAILIPNEGYTFAEEVNVIINGDDDIVKTSISYGSDLFMSTYHYWVKDPSDNREQFIDQVDITGFVVPAYGKKPNYDISVPKDVHYHVATKKELEQNYLLDQVYAKNGTIWSYYCESNFGQLKKNQVFDDPTCEYDAMIAIVADEGYGFADGVKVSINGKRGLVKDLEQTTSYLCVYSDRYKVEQGAAPVKKDDETPKTGDQSGIYVFMMSMMLAGCGIYVWKRRKA